MGTPEAGCPSPTFPGKSHESPYEDERKKSPKFFSERREGGIFTFRDSSSPLKGCAGNSSGDGSKLMYMLLIVVMVDEMTPNLY